MPVSRDSRILLFTLPVLVLGYYYAGWKLYHAAVALLPLRPLDIKVTLYGIGMLVSLYPLILLLLNRVSRDAPDADPEENRLLDITFAYPYWFGVIVLVEFLPWLLALDFLKLPFYPFFDRLREKWLLQQHKVVLVVFAILFLYILARIIHDTVAIKISHIQVRMNQIGAGLSGLRIVHISDFLLDRRTKLRRLRRYLRKAGSLNADLVVFTGNFATRNQTLLKVGAEMLGQVSAAVGVFACLGDSDTAPGFQQVLNHLQSQNITVLNNQNHLIHLRGQSALLTIVTNTKIHRPNLDTLNFLMGQQPRGALDILLAHRPSESLVEMAAERGYHLFFAGNTRGGQIRVRPFGARFSMAKLGTPYFSGMRPLSQMFVCTNSGLGFRNAPLRCRVPAEITLVEVLKAV